MITRMTGMTRNSTTPTRLGARKVNAVRILRRRSVSAVTVGALCFPMAVVAAATLIAPPGQGRFARLVVLAGLMEASTSYENPGLVECQDMRAQCEQDDFPDSPNGEPVAPPEHRTPGVTQPRSVTLMDVARAAGVGKSTVSNVLNGSGRVGDAARARVLEMIDQLGYRPNHGARSLRSRRTMQLAYFMPLNQLEPTNLIMMQFMQSLLRASARQHYRVLAVAQDADPLSDIRA